MTSSLFSSSSRWVRSSTWEPSLLLLSPFSRSLQQRFLENIGVAGLGRSSPRQKARLARLDYQCFPGENFPSLSPVRERGLELLRRYSILLQGLRLSSAPFYHQSECACSKHEQRRLQRSRSQRKQREPKRQCEVR